MTKLMLSSSLVFAAASKYVPVKVRMLGSKVLAFGSNAVTTTKNFVLGVYFRGVDLMYGALNFGQSYIDQVRFA